MVNNAVKYCRLTCIKEVVTFAHRMGLLLQQILFLVLLQCCVVVRSRPQGEKLKAPVSNERSKLKEIGRYRKAVNNQETNGECQLIERSQNFYFIHSFIFSRIFWRCVKIEISKNGHCEKNSCENFFSWKFLFAKISAFR